MSTYQSPAKPLTFITSLPWLLLVVGLISLPYVTGWLGTPENTVFTWALLNPDDMGVYVSAMRQGAHGEWLYHFTYSPEPWQPRLMLTLYLLIGKITALAAIPTVITLHFWRTIFAITAVYALIFYVRTIFPHQVRLQWTAWLLILFAGGFGWMAIMVTPDATRFSPDLASAEGSTVVALFNTPHFALGIALQALFFSFFVQMLQNNGHQMRWAALAAITAVFNTLTYVYHLAVIGLVVGLMMLWTATQQRSIPWRLWGMGAIIILPLLPLLGYYAFGANGDPFWIQYTQVDHVISAPPFWGLLVGLGGVGILAVIGSWWWWKKKRPLLIPLWAIVQIGLLYFPGLQFTARFGLGLTIPAATMAAVGLENVLLPFLARKIPNERIKRLTPTPYATTRRVILILLVPSTLMSMLLFVQSPRWQPEFPFYLPAADVIAAEWLGGEVDETAVTLTYYPLGNYLPRVYDGKVFMGQLDYTTNLDEKVQLYEQFWIGMTPDQQTQFLTEWGITHIIAGTYDAPFTQNGIGIDDALIYEKDGIRIWATESTN
jgi:hypothetical protein